MGFDYVLFHLYYTIPPCLVLSLFVYPLSTRLDLVKILFLIVAAVTATIPWCSYLVRTGIWSYPPDAVLGPALLSIPVEDLFSFVIQTHLTSQLYILLNKPILHAQYLNSHATVPAWIRRSKIGGQALLVGTTLIGAWLVYRNGRGTYLGLILAWTCPIALLTWRLTAHFILALPHSSTLVPILLPALYLWIVDEMALSHGTWSIESGTKLGVRLFGSLEIEEVVFFIATNTLVVLGLAAFDRVVAVADAFPDLFHETADSFTLSLVRAFFLSPKSYDMQRIAGIRDACARLKKKSRSFQLASSAFPGRLRIDMTLLYSYCRLADDLVDEAVNPQDAAQWVEKLRRHLACRYDTEIPGHGAENEQSPSARYAEENFPSSALSALEFLPTHLTPRAPLDELLDGFIMDLSFEKARSKNADPACFPIRTEDDLEMYATRVASTVGHLCVELAFYHCRYHADKSSCSQPNNKNGLSEADRNRLRTSARQMGLALQYVNIARDVVVDARIGRVYLPTTWLEEETLEGGPVDVLRDPASPAVQRVKRRLLDVAFGHYVASREAMRGIPKGARGPMTVAVESYMEIGRVLLVQSRGRSEGENVGSVGKIQKSGGAVVTAPLIAEKTRRATVPVGRRIWVAWSTLMCS